MWRRAVKLFHHDHNQLLVAGAYFFRHRRRLFGRDPRVDGDNEATRHVRIEVILIVSLGLTTLLVVEWVGLWIN